MASQWVTSLLGLAVSAIAVATPLAASHAGVIATYQFQGSLSADEPGRPSLAEVDPLGTSGFTTATVAGETRQVFRFSGNSAPGSQGGLVLNPSGLGITGDYAIEILFSLDIVNGWRRVLNTLPGSSDSGLYVLDGYLTPYPGNSPQPAVFTPGTFHQAIVNYTAAGQRLTGFVDNQPVFDLESTALTVAGSDIRFFLDDGVEYSPGTVGLIRIYDQPLSAAERASRFAEPLSGLTPVPIPAALWLFGSGMLVLAGWTRIRRQRT